ncbi:hypothetical protein ACF07B_10710 [Streptomyces sp. NPDC015532]|uniref:hypothetical protein n=1 Tax=Streptomyces sp. NPDC015532 TaxID=3364960 RepID=UPI003700D9BC
MDMNGWQSGHQVAYGCGAWERARHQARLLVAWYDERDHGLGTPGPRRFSADPGPRVKWPWGSARHDTLGLLLWRAAYDPGILVDQVLLPDALRHCAEGAEPLDAGPVPEAARSAGIGVGSAASVAGIRHVLQAHVEADLPRPRPAGARLTLGYRVRESRATPDWDLGDWPTALTRARQAMGRADDLRERGTWKPTDDERSAGARIGRGLERPAPSPAASGHPAPRWLERASRLTATADTLTATAATLLGAGRDHARQDDAGRDDASPLAAVLGTTADACARLRADTEEIGRLRAAEEPCAPSDRAAWERAWELSHVPGALLEQTEETEDLVRALAVFLWILAVR